MPSYSPLPSAIVAGHLCLDIIPQIDHLPEGRLEGLLQPGRLFTVGPAAIATGGAVSNTGIALHKLGIPVQLIAKVGADPFGQAIRSVIDSYGPQLSETILTDPAVSSSYTLIINPPGIDRIFWCCPAANDAFCAADVRDDQLAGAALFHFGYPTLMRRMAENGAAETIALFRRAKAAGITTSLDMSFPDPQSAGGRADWLAIFPQLLPFVDIFTPSIDELLFTLRRAIPRNEPGPETFSQLGNELLALGAKIILIKAGNRGAYLRTAGISPLRTLGRAVPADPRSWADQELWAPCFDVEVVGATGAGDAAIAGFLSALLRGLHPAAALTAAMAVGACNVEAADALSGLRSWDNTLARVAAGWPRRGWPLSAPGWAWDDSDQLWRKVA